MYLYTPSPYAEGDDSWRAGSHNKGQPLSPSALTAQPSGPFTIETHGGKTGCLA